MFYGYFKSLYKKQGRLAPDHGSNVHDLSCLITQHVPYGLQFKLGTVGAASALAKLDLRHTPFADVVPVNR